MIIKKLIKQLIKQLQLIPKSYFSIRDAGKFYDGKGTSLSVTLNRLVKREELTRIMKGYYTFNINTVDFEQFACEVKKNSYISLEYALYYHGLIDQLPEIITLVTSDKSAVLQTSTKKLEYSHFKKDLYFGYEIIDNMLMAAKEKAILDELYLIFLGKRSLTIKKEWFLQADKNLFEKWLKIYPVGVKKLFLRFT